MSGRKVTYKATIPIYVKRSIVVNCAQLNFTLLLRNLLYFHGIRSAGLGVLPP
jgi:hypothetical protein